MPEQPQASSSSMRQPVEVVEAPGPPYSSGMWVFISPSSQAFSMISWGQVPSLVVLPGDGANLLLGEVVRHLAQRLLLIGQREVDHSE